MLACGTPAMGLRRYCCASPHCTHAKYIGYSCKGKGCSACGMKATEQWIAEQQHILPDCEWQHITFTTPDKLWPLFANNWPLLNPLFSCAANTLMIYFKKKVVEAYWRQAVIKLLREIYATLDLSAAGYTHIRDYREWCQFLEVQFQRHWKIHFAKKTKHARQNVSNIGRYLKRPPMAASALRHYTGGAVIHYYYDHRTQQHRRQVLSQEEMLPRYISHIPHAILKWSGITVFCQTANAVSYCQKSMPR